MLSAESHKKRSQTNLKCRTRIGRWGYVGNKVMFEETKARGSESVLQRQEEEEEGKKG